MKTTKAKAGRKPKNYVTSWNETINGLTRRTDGRWKIIATGERFTEPDERLAVARFKSLTGIEPPTDALLLQPTDAKRYGPELDRILNSYDGLSAGTNPHFAIDPQQFWARVRKEILTRPKWVAEQVGIEQIGYLSQLQPPEKLPTPAELNETWKKHARCAVKQIKKTSNAWNDFVKTTGINDISQITAQMVVQYRDNVHARKLAPKQQQHIFGGIRRVVSFSKSRAVAVDTLSRILNYLSVLTSDQNATALDPHPISKEDFGKLYRAATGDDLAMILLMMNGAFYLQEVIRLEWDDIKNDCIVTRRQKTGDCIRICTLWPETIKALESVERKGPNIFRNWAGKPLAISGAHLRFDKLKVAAKVSGEVKASHFRDGAYTAAVEANVSSDLCRLLVGHRTGMADHYVQRKPSMVKPACDAVRSFYLGAATDSEVARNAPKTLNQ